jgi:hypothetical protein
MPARRGGRPRAAPRAALLALACAAAAAAAAAGAAAQALPPAPEQCTPDVISGVAWGAGTGAHQFEGAGGGRAPSVWEAFTAANPGAIADRTDAKQGADFYNRFKSDVQLMQKLGVRRAGEESEGRRPGLPAGLRRAARRGGGQGRRLAPGPLPLRVRQTGARARRAPAGDPEPPPHPLQMKHFRLSLSWPRLLPGAKKGSPPSPAAVKFYNELLDTLLAAGIQPIVALYHCEPARPPPVDCG